MATIIHNTNSSITVSVTLNLEGSMKWFNKAGHL